MICNQFRTEELRANGILQAWRRQGLFNMHSGVRVKIKRKDSSLIESVQSQIHQSNLRVQSMLKRLWFESEMSILSNNEQRKNHRLEIDHKNKIVNSIGIQTMIIRQIDRQISCHLISSSRNSISDTSVSNENSTHTSSSTSTGNSTTNESDNHHRWNRNRNNNAMDTKINMKDFKMTKLLNNEQSWRRDLDSNIQCYPQTKLSTRKKRFFDTVLNRISFLRLSSLTSNRTAIGTDINRNENIRSPISRCRRSAANRNRNHHACISLSKDNYLQRKTSIHSISNKSILTEKQFRQDNHSSLSMNGSHRSKKKSNKTNRRKHRHRKKYTNRSTHLQWSSSLKTLPSPSIVNENQPSSSSIDDQSKPIVPKIIKSSIHHTKKPNSIRLHVKTQNLISNFSKSKLSLSSIHPTDHSIQHHQMNTINELKLLLQHENIHPGLN